MKKELPFMILTICFCTVFPAPTSELAPPGTEITADYRLEKAAENLLDGRDDTEIVGVPRSATGKPVSLFIKFPKPLELSLIHI